MSRRTRCLAASNRRQPGAALGAADPLFVARLERQLEQAFAAAAPARGAAPPAIGRRQVRIGLPGLAELAVAAAVALAVGAGAVDAGARVLPAAAGTPTGAVDLTRTPHRPTVTATAHEPPAAATTAPVAMAHAPAGGVELGW